MRLRLKVIKLLFYLDSQKLLFECYPLWYSLQWQRHKHMLTKCDQCRRSKRVQCQRDDSHSLKVNCCMLSLLLKKKVFTVIAPECLTFFTFRIKNLPSNTFNYCWLMMGGQSVCCDLHFVAHSKHKYEDFFLLFDL